MRPAGRRARRAMNREPSIVSHGPATTSPPMTSSAPARYAVAWVLLFPLSPMSLA